jgi:hypothetical protein
VTQHRSHRAGDQLAGDQRPDRAGFVGDDDHDGKRKQLAGELDLDQAALIQVALGDRTLGRT